MINQEWEITELFHFYNAILGKSRMLLSCDGVTSQGTLIWLPHTHTLPLMSRKHDSIQSPRPFPVCHLAKTPFPETRPKVEVFTLCLQISRFGWETGFTLLRKNKKRWHFPSKAISVLVLRSAKISREKETLVEERPKVLKARKRECARTKLSS